MSRIDSSVYNHVLPEVIDQLTDENAYKNLAKEATRYAYAEAIIEVGEQIPEVVVLNADVAKSIKTTEFRERFPDREFNFGIAEQNMMAAAAGMATTGLIPFVSTYAVFASMRALDQLRNSVHYTNLNVKVAASHSGITPGPDGVTHQAQEDMSILRCLANSTVIAPADSATTKKAIHAVARRPGPAYISFTRDPVPHLFDETYPYEVGKAVTIREGTDVTIVAMRDLVFQALVAAELLAQDGVSARVIDCHTLKPLDEETILAAAKETGAVVAAENNVIFGGLGSAIAELLVENYLVPMKRVGIQDTFAESGPYLEVIDKYGLTSPHIIKAAQEVLARK